MIHKPLYNVYIASCEKDGGIFHYLFSDGRLSFKSYTHMDRPMYMQINNNKMHILLREYFATGESGLVVYDIDKDGRLYNPSEVSSTKGLVSCHLLVDNKNVYCANYSSGSIIKMPQKLVKHYGRSINEERQEMPHPHFVGKTPDNKYICVTDLGLDKILLYTKKLDKLDEIDIPEGHGPRHLVFSDDGKMCFVANELTSTVTALSYDNGRFEIIDTTSCIPSGFNANSTASAIRYSKDLVYVSNRGHNSISVMQFDNDKLHFLKSINCFGNYPRDFEIIEDFIIVTNEKSDNVSVIDKQHSILINSILNVKSPICVACTKVNSNEL